MNLSSFGFHRCSGKQIGLNWSGCTIRGSNHHPHLALRGRISLTLSCHPSLSPVAPAMSSRLHKESENIDIYLGLAGELNNQYKMQVTIILDIVVEFKTLPKGWERRLIQLKFGGITDTIKTLAFLDRPEYSEESWRPAEIWWVYMCFGWGFRWPGRNFLPWWDCSAWALFGSIHWCQGEGAI